MKKPREPRAETLFTAAELQHIDFRKPTDDDFKRIAQEDSPASPATEMLYIRELTIKPFTVIPAHANSKHELVYMPKHGYADIFIWDAADRMATIHKLHMGENPVIVPVGRSCAIRTFASTVRLCVVANPLNHLRGASSKRPRIYWQSNAAKLCMNKHHIAS